MKKIRVQYKETRVIEKEVYIGEEMLEDVYKKKGEEKVIKIGREELGREELGREELVLEDYSKKLKSEGEEGIYSVAVGELSDVYIGEVLIGKG